jgi:hypothetical protein
MEVSEQSTSAEQAEPQTYVPSSVVDDVRIRVAPASSKDLLRSHFWLLFAIQQISKSLTRRRQGIMQRATDLHICLMIYADQVKS